MGSILPRARKPCHSERSETASSLQPSAPHSVIPSASEESWLDFNLTESNETAAKPRRPPCPSARSETAPSLQPSAPSCHSERSEESWLGFNPAETNETRRKTPVGRLSFRAQRDRSLSAA